MDTNKLVVGQEVWMQSGPYALKGKVTMFIDQCVMVEVPQPKNAVRGFIKFDANGKTGTGWDGLGYFELIGCGLEQCDPRPVGTKYGTWELTDKKPISLRTAPGWDV